ncbi:MAG: acyl-CoA mutase large subunit family protein [bacterium]|nr:acyl-CoA mutase large subunit family protein [bacterium]
MSQSKNSAESGSEQSVDTTHLFDEFQSVSRETWEQKIRKDLKLDSDAAGDAALKKKTAWRTTEGFELKPFYDAADLEGLQLPETHPGSFPFLRGRSTANNNWEIREEIYDADPVVANRRALAALEAGVDAVCFVITCEAGQLRGVDLSGDASAAFQKLVAGVWLDAAAIHFRAGVAAPLVLALLHAEVKRQNLDPAKISGTIDYDPMSQLTGEGALDLKSAMATAAALIEFTRKHLPGIRPLAVSDRIVHNAGAGIVESLALALAAGNEMLANLSDAGTPGELTADQISRALTFDVSVSSNYFMEIARMRAARLLWSRIVHEYDPAVADGDFDQSGERGMYIHGHTSRFNQTVYDPHVNLLRATTEAMSAALGACDAFTVLPFDLARSPDATDEFGARMARNTQQVIKHEAYLDKVVDPAAGSYYLENLTERIAREAWAFFQEIEAAGGYVKALAPANREGDPADGLIQTRIKASAEEARAAVASRKQTVLGTNQYPNGQELARDTIKAGADRPAPAMNSGAGIAPIPTGGGEAAQQWMNELPALAGKHGYGAVIANLSGAPDTRVAALSAFRAADEFEALRLATEAHVAAGKAAPKVFLVAYGDLAMRKARSMFAANFFSCAGYQIIDQGGFDTAAAGAAAAAAAGADIVVFCSSDAEYDQAVAAAKNTASGGRPIPVVAGNPADHIDALKAAGVRHLIHARSNVLAELQGFQKELGV